MIGDSEPGPTAKPAAVIAVLSLAALAASFMQTILLPMQGELPELLGAPREDTAWVITITLLTWTISTPISGRLGDMYGKRLMTLALLGLLALGSVVSALSASVAPLVVGRGLQGMGLGVVALGISILRDVLPPQRLGIGIALVSATVGVGGALGLPIGAVISEHLEWHLLFWLTAAVAVAAIVAVARVIPVSALRTGGRLDLADIVGMTVGLSGVLLAVSRSDERGWGRRSSSRCWSAAQSCSCSGPGSSCASATPSWNFASAAGLQSC